MDITTATAVDPVVLIGTRAALNAGLPELMVAGMTFAVDGDRLTGRTANGAVTVTFEVRVPGLSGVLALVGAPLPAEGSDPADATASTTAPEAPADPAPQPPTLSRPPEPAPPAPHTPGHEAAQEPEQEPRQAPPRRRRGPTAIVPPVAEDDF